MATFQRHATSTNRRGRRLFLEVSHWLAADDLDWPFSFVSICHALSLDAAHLREGLARWAWRQTVTPDGAVPVTRFPFRRMSGSRTRARVGAIGLRRSA